MGKIYLLVVISLLLVGCKKDNPKPIDQLPAITQEGKIPLAVY